MKLPTSSCRKFLSICLLAYAGAALAQQSASQPNAQPNTQPNQQANRQQARPAAQPAQPPKLERIEEGSDVPITVTPPKTGGAQITEKREGGRVTEAKVKSGGSEYTLRPNAPAGNAQPGDAVSSSTRPPQWTVLEFDLNKKKNTDKEAAAQEAAAPPPPPAPTGVK
jgi:hypothetical protein